MLKNKQFYDFPQITLVLMPGPCLGPNLFRLNQNFLDMVQKSKLCSDKNAIIWSISNRFYSVPKYLELWGFPFLKSKNITPKVQNIPKFLKLNISWKTTVLKLNGLYIIHIIFFSNSLIHG